MVTPRPGLGSLRDEQHQSQDDVHNLTGLHKATIVKIERGEEVLASKLAIYAKHFGLELDLFQA